jgi:pimeloyl-ACP methyl ester carboxylesterase
LTAALLAALVYVGIVLWFRHNEDSLIFSPDCSQVRAPSPALGLESRDVELSSADGVKLQARLIPPPSSVPRNEAAWLLYLHGSSGSIGLPAYNEAWAEFRRRGLGVFALDYRGFGESEGMISEAGIYRDAEAAYDYLRSELKIPPQRILLYGFSMGAAVAIDLATRVEAAGLMVEGAWLSIPRLGSERYPFLPISLVARNRFSSEEKVREVAMPKLFVHARADGKVPIGHGRRLFELAVAPKQFHALGGEHGTSHRVDSSFFSVVGEFVAARGLPLAEP